MAPTSFVADTVGMAFIVVNQPVVDVVRKVQFRHFLQQSEVLHRIERYAEIKSNDYHVYGKLLGYCMLSCRLYTSLCAVKREA